MKRAESSPVSSGLFDWAGEYAEKMERTYQKRKQNLSRAIDFMKQGLGAVESDQSIIQKAIQIFMSEFSFPLDASLQDLSIRASKVKKNTLPGLPVGKGSADEIDNLRQELETAFRAHWDRTALIFGSHDLFKQKMLECLNRARSGEKVGN